MVKPTDKLRALIAVTQPWDEQFFDHELLDQLKTSYGDVVRVDPIEISPTNWEDLFQDVRPHAVLTAWDTPSIPNEALPDLGFVAHTGGEVRRLVDRKMIEEGLLVSNWGELAAPSVAECALMLILCSLRQITHWTFLMHNDRLWPERGVTPGQGLFGRRVGLHGFGKIAQSLVSLLRPFNCQILSYSAGVPAQLFEQHGVEQVDSVESLFENSDVLVELEALTPHTRGSVNESLLRRLPDGAVFVNVGRGPVVDEAALTKIALEGRLQIAVDVYEVEPLPATSTLRGLPNVTLLPHVAGPTMDRRRDCGCRAIDNLHRFARGERPLGLVTLDVYDRST